MNTVTHCDAFSGLINDIELMWEHDIAPNFYFYGPDEDKIYLIVHTFLTKIYKSLKPNMILELNLSGEMAFDVVNICDIIIQFCSLKSFFRSDNLPKVLLLIQNNEKISDAIVSILEDISSDQYIRVIIISNNLHTLSPIIKPKLMTLMIPRSQYVDNSKLNYISLHDQNKDKNLCVDTLTDIDIHKKLNIMSNIMELNPSPHLLDLYFSLPE
jgi:hypothetical protein